MGSHESQTMHCPKLCALLIFGVALTVVSLDDSESELDSAHVIAGRRGGGGFLSAVGTFILSSNRAGNDELEDQDSGELEEENRGSSKMIGSSRTPAPTWALKSRLGHRLGQPTQAASIAAITSAAVKCSGNAQNQAQLNGTMDCETKSFKNKATHKGSECLDNLSSGKHYMSINNGLGACRPFNSIWAFGSVTTKDLTSNQSRSGIVTKAFVAHPNMASRTVGVFGFKRVLCNKNGGQCATFKNAVCIKCPEPIFAKIYEVHATVQEKSKFIDCCVLGHKQYKVEGKGWARDCAANMAANMTGTGAFTAFNDAAAELKEAYQCSGDDVGLALTLVSSA